MLPSIEDIKLAFAKLAAGLVAIETFSTDASAQAEATRHLDEAVGHVPMLGEQVTRLREAMATAKAQATPGATQPPPAAAEPPR